MPDPIPEVTDPV